MADFDSVCAALCLASRAAFSPDMPPPLTRPMLRRMLASGALSGLVLRSVDGIEPELLLRAEMLLSRAKDVYRCLEGYYEKGYRVLLPQDDAWPDALCVLGGHAPAFLFLHGDDSALAGRRLSVAGSRVIEENVRDEMFSLGRRITEEGFSLVCGDAPGVDEAVLRGTLNAGGRAVIVPAQPDWEVLDRALIRDALECGRLLVLCDVLPDDPFTPQRALARNHVIYALGEAAIAVAARQGVGGTWRGALDCLAVGAPPVLIPKGEALAGQGGAELLRRGAQEIDLSKPIGKQFSTGRQIHFLDL